MMNLAQIKEAVDQHGVIGVASRIQLAWIAAIGMTRRRFVLAMFLIGACVPFAFWVGYQSELGEALRKAYEIQEYLALFANVTLLALTVFYWVCVLLAPAAVLAMLSAGALGMFSQQFWLNVERLRAQDSRTPH